MEAYALFVQTIARHPVATLTDFGFTPPVLAVDESVIVVEGNLGIAANHIEPLWRHAHALYFAATNPIDKRDSSILLLLFNPELYSAWNVRKALLKTGTVTLSNELALVNLVLSKHPKRPAAWAHRAWLLPQLVSATLPEHIDAFYAAELEACRKAALRHRMNYHAWTYRWKVVRNASLQFKLFAFQEVKAYIASHISEHSAFAHALAILESIKNEKNHPQPDTVKALFESELRETMGLIARYPGHKSPWCYLQGLFLIANGPESRETFSASLDDLRFEDSWFGGVLASREDGRLFSDVDVLDWLQLWIAEEKWERTALSRRILAFSAWIIAASRVVIASHTEEAPIMWKNQIEAALEFLLYLLQGRNGTEDLRLHVKGLIEREGTCPAFLLLTH
ncbi:Protein prenyltransferase alpha subunit repeat-containing protein 1 [Chytriomyces hyalinus]|nr:Protein prenyltransferase alpha subunit repeat-containing protein 1 [Chytriomyces hyalinus]